MTTILITGAGGYIGKKVIERLTAQQQPIGEAAKPLTIVATDLNIPAPEMQKTGVVYEKMDVTSDSVADIFSRHKPDSVIHLASIVDAGSDEALGYKVDILGTKNILDNCVKHGTSQIIVTSSGAAYGYHSDNPAWLNEHCALRGNDDFVYARHKRMVEEMMADFRRDHPALKQLILRCCTVLGATTDNQITALFHKAVFLEISGANSGFVFIWDEDLTDIITKGVNDQRSGIFNVAGTGALYAKDIAKILKKRRLIVPAWLMRMILNSAHLLGLSQASGKHVKFLQFRPVLDNKALIDDFGYVPQKTSEEAFKFYLQAYAQRK